jgi:uncharacterized repeat protein (TIGR01451 family)
MPADDHDPFDQQPDPREPESPQDSILPAPDAEPTDGQSRRRFLRAAVIASAVGAGGVAGVALARQGAQQVSTIRLIGAAAVSGGPSADLSILKDVSSARPNVGDTITFGVTVTNNGPNPATNVTVTDLLPAGLSFVSATPSQGSYNAGTGVWSVGSLAVSGSATLLIQATVTSPNPMTNTASISHSDQVDPNTANNTATITVTPQQADLAVQKTGPDSAAHDQTFAYNITVTNNGPDAATNVTVTDLLPVGLSFVSATPSQGSYNNGTGVWSVGSLAVGVSATLVIHVTATAGSKTNTASISHSDQFDPVTSNNSASVTILVS